MIDRPLTGGQKFKEPNLLHV
jgi:hypothetical protein